MNLGESLKSARLNARESLTTVALRAIRLGSGVWDVPGWERYLQAVEDGSAGISIDDLNLLAKSYPLDDQAREVLASVYTIWDRAVPDFVSEPLAETLTHLRDRLAETEARLAAEHARADALTAALDYEREMRAFRDDIATARAVVAESRLALAVRDLHAARAALQGVYNDF